MFKVDRLFCRSSPGASRFSCRDRRFQSWGPDIGCRLRADRDLRRPATSAAGGCRQRRDVQSRPKRLGCRPVRPSRQLGPGRPDRRFPRIKIKANRRAFLTETPAEALNVATGKTWHAVSDTVVGIARAITTGRGTQNFAGVIGITQLAGQAAVAGDTSLFTLIAILSANLAFNEPLPHSCSRRRRARILHRRVGERPTRVFATSEFCKSDRRCGMLAMFLLSMLHGLSGFRLFQ